MYVWAALAVAFWLVLQLLAMKWCTGWREDKSLYGFAVLGLILWCVPDVLFGSSGAKAVEQILFFVGFPVAAVYTGSLLIAEFIARLKERAEG